MAKCVDCGKELPEDVKYCTICGADQFEEAVGEAQPLAAEPLIDEEEVVVAPVAEPPATEAETARNPYELAPEPSGESSFIAFKNVSKTYVMGEVTIKAVDGADFNIEEGELALIVGSSGAGKTTVLNILGGMDSADGGKGGGEVWVDGKEITRFSDRKLTEYRRNQVGFVFQFYNLIPNLTALENLEIATQLSENPLAPEEVLRQVGLEERTKNFPAQLSGGEQQRVSIARALAKNPRLLLCDEPTGALDYATGKQILSLLQKTCRETGMTVIIITHNTAIEPIADRVIRMRSGKIHQVTLNRNPKDVAELDW